MRYGPDIHVSKYPGWKLLACGEPAALDRLAQWLLQGPPMAKVQSVTVEAFDGACPGRFTAG